MIVWLIIGILAILFVLPCLLVAGRTTRNEEMCKHCIYEEWRNGKGGPCYRCIDCDHFERKVEDG